MELIPAIDLYQGRCVRLFRGRFDRVTRYDVAPVELARRYADAGARWLHLVDLDGARDGYPGNTAIIESILAATPLSVQVGGGLRHTAAVHALLEAGASRVVIGSLAVRETRTVGDWLRAFGGERIVLALDVRLREAHTEVVTDGWTRGSEHTLEALVEHYAAHGLRHVLCTDVERDGAMEGPAVALYRRCHARFPGIAWQASGGIRDAADLEALREAGAAGAISGRALLEGALALDAVAAYLPGAAAGTGD